MDETKNFEIVCRCGIGCAGQVINVDAALERNGWRKVNGQWECPTCTGNTRQFWKNMLSGDPFGRKD